MPRHGEEEDSELHKAVLQDVGLDALYPKPQHLSLIPQCGACGDSISAHERVVVLPGASDGISFGGKISRPFPFPKNVACLPIHYQCNRNKSHSTKPNCPVCKRSNPAVVLHSWCLKVVTNTEANLDMPEIDLDAIWTVGVWRRPYAGAPLIALDDRGPAIFSDKDMKILAELASLVGLDGLGKLPREIVCTIWKLSGPGPFWRAVECLKTRATAINASPVSYTPLVDISSWDRDAGLKMVSRSKANSVSGDSMSSMDPLPFTFPEQIRITIDRQGIRCIDRGYKDTNHEYRPNTISTDQVFIVINVGAMTTIEQSQLQVEVKNGLLRLHLADSYTRLRLWNTPEPPKADVWPMLNASSGRSTLHVYQVPDIPDHVLLHTIDPSRCRGLTFVSRGNKLLAIQPHHGSQADAKVRSEYAQHSHWTIKHQYVPIGPADRIVAVWACWAKESNHASGMEFEQVSHVYFVVRLALAGDVVCGKVLLDHNGVERNAGLYAYVYDGNPQPEQSVAAVLARMEALEPTEGLERTLTSHGSPSTQAPLNGARRPPVSALHTGLLRESKTPLLLYGESLETSCVYLGPYLESRNPEDPRDPLPAHLRTRPRIWPPPLSIKGWVTGIHCSSASLANVASVRVFEDTRLHICQGFLLFYNNGSIRALGECRPGYNYSGDDEATTAEDRRTESTYQVMDPKAICLRQIRLGTSNLPANYGLQIHVADSTSHRHRASQRGWQGAMMGRGTVYFYIGSHRQWEGRFYGHVSVR